jgi:1-acyl-sn-glycerol-3-phosphate acyltransferase
LNRTQRYVGAHWFAYFCAVKAIKAPFSFLWKVWFYIVVFCVILAISPFILYSSRSEKQYPQFFRFSRVWAKGVLFLIGVRLKRKSTVTRIPKQVIIVANHTSMLDIPCTLVLVPRTFLFIGKKELAKLPIFGFFYKRTNILVDRGSVRSRSRAFEIAAQKLDEGLSICIYPEGGVPDPSVRLGNFKDGAFRLAIEKNIPILPITFGENKRHFPYSWFEGGPGILGTTVHPVIETKGKTIKELREETRAVISKELEFYGVKE